MNEFSTRTCYTYFALIRSRVWSRTCSVRLQMAIIPSAHRKWHVLRNIQTGRARVISTGRQATSDMPSCRRSAFPTCSTPPEYVGRIGQRRLRLSSICAEHMRQSGSTAALGLAFTLQKHNRRCRCKPYVNRSSVMPNERIRTTCLQTMTVQGRRSLRTYE